ncbi:FAD-binding protein [Candidatus Parvarchaeota archaeon]|nr:FAD-binding protein [Candidatus Parvarchaeota archaeon]
MLGYLSAWIDAEKVGLMATYDVLVIGGGVAGLTAAMFTSRRKLSTAVVSFEYGGQTAIPAVINNYPGFESIGGGELMGRMRKQALSCGVEAIDGKVSKIEKSKGGFEATLSNGGRHFAKALILAYGKSPRMLGVQGEEKYIGKGVYPNVIHNPELYKGKTVAVIGGGNSAFGTAIECAQTGKLVYVVNRSEKFRGEETLLEKIKILPNVRLLTNKVVDDAKGDEKWLREIIIRDVASGAKETLEVDFMFENIGLEVKNDFCAHLVRLNEYKEIEVNGCCETGVPGLFAAGDATNIPFKQTVISAGEGAKAGIQAYKYVKGDKSRTSLDWTH